MAPNFVQKQRAIFEAPCDLPRLPPRKGALAVEKCYAAATFCLFSTAQVETKGSWICCLTGQNIRSTPQNGVDHRENPITSNYPIKQKQLLGRKGIDKHGYARYVYWWSPCLKLFTWSSRIERKTQLDQGGSKWVTCRCFDPSLQHIRSLSLQQRCTPRSTAQEKGPCSGLLHSHALASKWTIPAVWYEDFMVKQRGHAIHKPMRTVGSDWMPRVWSPVIGCFPYNSGTRT